MSDSLKSLYPGSAELEERLRKAEWVLSNAGFRRCDIPACNCGSWHQIGGFKARFDEILEAVQEADYSTNGKTLLEVVKEVIADAKRSGDPAQAPNRNELTQIICDALWGPRPIELRNDMVAKAGSRAADAVLNRFAGVANDAAESPRDHLSEMAFEVWRKSLKSQSRFSNEQLFTDGYVAGWNDASAHSPDPAQSAVKQIELEEIARRAVYEYPVASGLYVDADSKAGYGALRDLRLFLGIEPAGHATSVVPSTTCPKPCPQLAQGESWCVWPKCSCSVPSTKGK